MKKNIMYIICFIIILLLIILFSYLFMNYNNGSKYKFNDNVNFDDLINLYYEDDKINLCENCVYMCSNWDDKETSLLLKYDGEEYETIDVYGVNYVTNLGVKIGDSYKKVVAYYGILDNYAYWNAEFKNGDIFYYNYPNDIVDDNNLVNAYLRFIYYNKDGEWVLLDVNRAKKIDSLGLEEYIMFTFEFSFNGNSKNVKDKIIAAYSIYYKKN
ncbi:MAG: hypothetical protein IJN90_05970 [Bacilli bacterium]|nr:hypothetical protein [Bacilli bacterium]MBQ7105386.1 hypothetical protein [Bacilli bacterium]